VTLGTPLVDFVFKPLFHRPRPWFTYPDVIPLYPHDGWAFPAGHTFITVGWLLPLLLAWGSDWRAVSHWLRLVAGLALAFMLLMPLSRLVAGVHHPSDLLGSCGLVLLLVGIVRAIVPRCAGPATRALIARAAPWLLLLRAGYHFLPH